MCDHLFKKAADERAARQQQKSAASSTTAQTAETTHKTPQNSAEHEAQRVEALRTELKETLPAPKTADRRRPPALKPATRDASRIPTPDLATRAQQDDEEFPAASQAPSTQYGAPSSYSGILSAPLPPANAMMSFSAVEEQVHRRGQHNRAATIEPSNYIAEEGIAGPPQLGSVVRTRRSGQSRPRIFTGSFNALENGMQQLRLVENYGTTTREATERTGRHGPIVVRDFATPSGSGTPVTSIPPSPVTLSHRHDARLGREHENQNCVVDRRPRPEPRQLDRTRTETLGNTGTSFTEWLEQPGRNNNDRPRSSSSRRRRERTL